MNHIDFYSGEPVSGSPPFTGTSNMSMTYSDPNLRFNQMNQYGYQNQFISPGMNGYNPYPQQQFGQPPMNPGFYGFQGNPAITMLQGGQFSAFQQPIYQDRVVHVPAFMPGGDVLYDFDVEQKCNELCSQMMVELEEARLKREAKLQNAYMNSYGSTNFYGLPYYSNQYVDQEIVNKYRRMAEEIRQEAVNRKLSFNKHLAKLACNYVGQEYTEEQINELYTGRTYTVTAAQQQEDVLQQQLANMKPVSNQNMYLQHHMEVHNTYSKLIGDTADMNDFLRAQGLVRTVHMLEDDINNRRQANQYYDSDAYKRHLRNAIIKREGLDPQTAKTEASFSSNFPILSQNGAMLEDGTISITAPNFFGVNNNLNRNFVINNQMEQHYQENRNAFFNSIMNPENK